MPYTGNEVFKKHPFATLDTTGVGQFVEIAVKRGAATRPGIKLGICQNCRRIVAGYLPLVGCGEHGGDPDSVKFFHQAGLAYVSCSPCRVPVARLAAAQAAIEEKRAAGPAKAVPAKKKK